MNELDRERELCWARKKMNETPVGRRYVESAQIDGEQDKKGSKGETVCKRGTKTIWNGKTNHGHHDGHYDDEIW